MRRAPGIVRQHVTIDRNGPGNAEDMIAWSSELPDQHGNHIKQFKDVLCLEMFSSGQCV